MKRSTVIVASAAIVWLGLTWMLRERFVLEGAYVTLLIALFTAVPVAYVATRLLLVGLTERSRDRLRQWSAGLQLGLCLFVLGVMGLAWALDWTSQLPSSVAIGVPLLLFARALQLGVEARSRMRRQPHLLRSS